MVKPDKKKAQDVILIALSIGLAIYFIAFNNILYSAMQLNLNYNINRL